MISRHPGPSGSLFVPQGQGKRTKAARKKQAEDLLLPGRAKIEPCGVSPTCSLALEIGKPHNVIADVDYGYRNNYDYLDGCGMETYIKHPGYGVENKNQAKPRYKPFTVSQRMWNFIIIPIKIHPNELPV